MAFKMKYKNLKEVVKQLDSAVIAHGKQARTIEKHIEEMESPNKQTKPKFKSKVKTRGGKTIIKTKGDDGYKSKIVLDRDGEVTKAKNTETKNKNKKDPRRTKRSNWIDRDLTGYRYVQSQIKNQKLKPSDYESGFSRMVDYYNKKQSGS
jgi:hypothetical protein